MIPKYYISPDEMSALLQSPNLRLRPYRTTASLKWVLYNLSPVTLSNENNLEKDKIVIIQCEQQLNSSLSLTFLSDNKDGKIDRILYFLPSSPVLVDV